MGRLKKGKSKGGGLGFLGILLIIILLTSGVFRSLVLGLLGLGLLAAAFFIIRAVVKAVKEDSNPARNPVDVSTKGVNQKKAEQGGPAARPATQPKPAAKKTYPPEVQAVVDEGKRAHTELEHLYATIPNLSVKAKIRELINVSDKIIEDAVNDPSDVPQI